MSTLFFKFSRLFSRRTRDPLCCAGFRLCGSVALWVLCGICRAGSGRSADAVPPCHAVPCVGLLRALCGAFLAVGGLLHPPTVCGAVRASVGGCGGAFLIQWYLRSPCAPVVPCDGSVCPLRGSDGVPCPTPPLRTICASVGALGGSECILPARVMLCLSCLSPCPLSHPLPICRGSAGWGGCCASAPPICSASAPPLPAVPTLHRSAVNRLHP